MTTQDVLRQAKELLSDPSRWTQGATARTKSGYMANWAGDLAVSWCARGALFRATRGATDNWGYIDAERCLREAVVRDTDDDSLVWFNDNPDTTHADIIAAFDRALLLAAERDAENVLVALS